MTTILIKIKCVRGLILNAKHLTERREFARAAIKTSKYLMAHAPKNKSCFKDKSDAGNGKEMIAFSVQPGGTLTLIINARL